MAEIDYSMTPVSYSDIESFTQGVEINDLSRRKFISALPVIRSSLDDFSVEGFVLGQGHSEDAYTPFFDRRGRMASYELLDNRYQTLSEVQSYKTEDDFTLNGVIEPLDIRTTLTYTPADFPGARTMKGDLELLSVNSRPSQFASNVYEIEQFNAVDDAFFDSQDVSIGKALPGFAGMRGRNVRPFNDESSQVTASIYNSGRYFRHGGEFGEARKSAGTGMTYDNARYGTDSLAFGGLLR